MRITILRGDITQQDVDAIVNAANPIMLGGGGVDGAIHKAAGPRLKQACYRVAKNERGIRCPTGEARLTEAGELPARFVIHTVGPRYRTDPTPADNLARAFRNSLDLAEEHDLRTLAFPAIGCGAYGYPLQACAEIARTVLQEQERDLDEVRFVLFDRTAFSTFQNVFEA